LLSSGVTIFLSSGVNNSYFYKLLSLIMVGVRFGVGVGVGVIKKIYGKNIDALIICL
jgi:hypothetical protein